MEEYSAYLLTQQELLDVCTASAGVRVNRNTVTGPKSCPQVGLAARLGETTLRANVGKGFRSPTIRELYLFPAPTPTLKAERLWSYEAGVLHRFAEQHADRSLRLHRRRQQPDSNHGAFPNLVLSNSGAVHTPGDRDQREFHPGAVLHRSMQRTATSIPTSRRPRTRATNCSSAASYGFSMLTLSASVQHVARLFGADFNQRRLPDYTLVSLRMSAAVGAGLSAYVAAENLFDTDYQIVYDYPMPGRTLFAGLRWSVE